MVIELARKIIQITKSSSEIEYHCLPYDDPVRRCPDISCAQKTLNWKPIVPLDVGLKKTVEFFADALAQQTDNGGYMFQIARDKRPGQKSKWRMT